MDKKKKRGNLIRSIIFAAALVVFAVSAYQLFMIYMEYKKGSDEYKGLAGKAEKILVSAEETEEAESGENNESAAGPWMDLYNAMIKENEDYIGWITIEDTNINYPIVQCEDNDYYLTHTFEREENASGALFVDSGIQDRMEGKNVIVYGHNMKNGSMFANLKKYREDEFFDDHRRFEVYTSTGHYTYEVFSVCTVSPDSDTYTIGFADDADFMNYIQKMQSRSIHKTGVTVSAEDKIITLSTCVNHNVDRLIVQAKRLES
ncbi:class B sortase [Qiania dongpingensis]|uniref:Class B sortase n=1 Tax=Qiania dongpingensis TaxID=2763669 RepID=A0A7G9G7F6_9FIRM|nr:class B sortase [Qiania dongpingensis]QNM06738.1 class B sortase [Qiania dongpingensis]